MLNWPGQGGGGGGVGVGVGVGEADPHCYVLYLSFASYDFFIPCMKLF